MTLEAAHSETNAATANTSHRPCAVGLKMAYHQVFCAGRNNLRENEA